MQFVTRCYGLRGIYGRFDSKIRFEIESDGRFDSNAKKTIRRSLTILWANAQRDGRPAIYRWRSLFNAAVWLTPTTRVPCSNAAKT